MNSRFLLIAATCFLALTHFIVQPLQAQLAPENPLKRKQPLSKLIKEDSNLSTFSQALETTDLNSILQGPGPYTIFVPTNDAFAKLPAELLKQLMKPESVKKLNSVLSYHVVNGKILAGTNPMKLKTLNGKPLDIRLVNSQTIVNNAKVIKTNIIGSNGVVHLIDTVLFP